MERHYYSEYKITPDTTNRKPPKAMEKYDYSEYQTTSDSYIETMPDADTLSPVW